ncbi:MAG TPA: RES domain-containing protein [Aurantimonas coralicida]|uniref:RES domain-containing protein n=2 Tax=root TaxID=1 RepID=A0A9C9NG44_9HYPH|nr:RES domain-containing protein [Aurantimonas coralicida]HEU00685.1 RES domain-containing protein [Aurantimonas coralicida]
MWMPSVVADYSAEDINQLFFTLIPSRFPTIDVFARIANNRSPELAEIESLTNPRLRERDRLMQGAQVVDGNGPLLQNWNHAPFAYQNPEGTRFFDADRPALELAGDMQTALAISIRKRETFLGRTAEAPMGLEMRELSRRVKGRFANGLDWDTDLDLAERRRRGREIAEAGYDGLLFRPAERPSGMCVSVLTGRVLERAVQRDHFKFVWDGSRVSVVYSFGSGAEYRSEDLRGITQILAA